MLVSAPDLGGKLARDRHTGSPAAGVTRDFQRVASRPSSWPILCPDTIGQARDAAAAGLKRVSASSRLCFAFLAHMGLSL